MFESFEARLCLLVGGFFFLVALATGVWKYRWMARPPDHRAPFYVDTAHRAALLYSFAAVLLAHLVSASPFPRAVNLAAVIAPLFFFAVAIGDYILLGIGNRTDNQFRRSSALTTTLMWLLIVGELGGASVLVVGFALGAFA